VSFSPSSSAGSPFSFRRARKSLFYGKQRRLRVWKLGEITASALLSSSRHDEKRRRRRRRRRRRGGGGGG